MQLKGDISGLDSLERQLEDVYLDHLADAGEKGRTRSHSRG